MYPRLSFVFLDVLPVFRVLALFLRFPGGAPETPAEPETPATPSPVTVVDDTPSPVTPETPSPVTPETPTPVAEEEEETPSPVTPVTPAPYTPAEGKIACAIAFYSLHNNTLFPVTENPGIPALPALRGRRFLQIYPRSDANHGPSPFPIRLPPLQLLSLTRISFVCLGLAACVPLPPTEEEPSTTYSSEEPEADESTPSPVTPTPEPDESTPSPVTPTPEDDDSEAGERGTGCLRLL